MAKIRYSAYIRGSVSKWKNLIGSILQFFQVLGVSWEDDVSRYTRDLEKSSVFFMLFAGVELVRMVWKGFTWCLGSLRTFSYPSLIYASAFVVNLKAAIQEPRSPGGTPIVSTLTYANIFINKNSYQKLIFLQYIQRKSNDHKFCRWQNQLVPRRRQWIYPRKEVVQKAPLTI